MSVILWVEGGPRDIGVLHFQYFAFQVSHLKKAASAVRMTVRLARVVIHVGNPIGCEGGVVVLPMTVPIDLIVTV